MLKNSEIEYIEFNSEASKCAVFLHGYGANAQDLSGFHTLKFPEPIRWVLPNGPLKLDGFGGRAWFPLRINTSDNRLYPTEETLTYFDQHCSRLLKLIKSLNIEEEKLILGGFSQGSMMALHLALRMPRPPRGLVIMSGSFFPPEKFKEVENFSKGGSFFQSHGRQDSLLYYSDAEKVTHFLQDLKWEGRLVSFEGGHEIPHAVLLEIQDYMNQRFS